MSSRTKLYCADTGIPVDSQPTPEEEALARTMPFHGTSVMAPPPSCSTATTSAASGSSIQWAS